MEMTIVVEVAFWGMEYLISLDSPRFTCHSSIKKNHKKKLFLISNILSSVFSCFLVT